MPVLALVALRASVLRWDSLQPLATDLQSPVVRGAGHWLAEEAPAEMLKALASFLAPYRESAGARGSQGRSAA